METYSQNHPLCFWLHHNANNQFSLCIASAADQSDRERLASPILDEMTTGPALTEIQLPPIPSKENGFNPNRLVSKITRSPTSNRRHRPVPSQESDILPDPSPVTQGAVHSRRNQPRPAFQRQISAPDTFVSPLARAEEDVRHHSDATGLTAQQAKAMLNQQPLLSTLATTATPSAKGTTQGSMFSAPLVTEYYTRENSNTGPHGVNYIYQQLYELSQKRITTLQYMRRA